VPITGDRESNDGLAKDEAPPDDEPDYPLALRQADQARSDFAAIESDLQFVVSQLARHLGARQFDGAKRRRYACRLNRRSSAASAGAQELASSATCEQTFPRWTYPIRPLD